MGLIVLHIRANLENVARLSLPEGHTYCIDVKDSTGEDVRAGVRVTCAESHEIPGSKGEAHYVMKWSKDARHAATLNVVPVKKFTRDYTEADSGKWVPLMGFECRGLEPVGWHPEGNFAVETTSGQKFADVDLSEKEWCDFDEKLKESCGIYELESKFQAHK